MISQRLPTIYLIKGLLRPVDVASQNQLVFGYRQDKAYTDILGHARLRRMLSISDAIVNGSYDIDKLKQEFSSVNRWLSDSAINLQQSSPLSKAAKRSGLSAAVAWQVDTLIEHAPDLVKLIDSGQRAVGDAFSLAEKKVYP